MKETRTVSRSAFFTCAGVNPISVSMPTTSGDGSGPDVDEPAPGSWIGASISVIDNS